MVLKPTLLFISQSSPYPQTDGKRQRTWALLNAILEVYTVDFLILDSSKEEVISLNKDNLKSNLHFFSLTLAKESRWLKKIGLSYMANTSNRKTLSEFLKSKSYNKIFCRYAHSAKDLPLECKFFLDVDDDYVEQMNTKISLLSSRWKKLRFYQLLILNRFFYKKILNRADQLIWVRKGNIRGHILPNLPFQILLSGIQELMPPQTKNILFIGKLSYEPNSIGIQWFLEDVWPKLKINTPNIELTIISSVKPYSLLQKLIDKSDSVSLHVNVNNVQKFYCIHAICIVPIFSGGGSNIKLVEALLMGRKVISTEFGLRGFESWVNSKEVKLANTPQEWVNRISETMNEPWEKTSWEKLRIHFSLNDWNQRFLKVLNES